MILSVADVARAFGVDPDTVRIWEGLGKLPKATRTLGGVVDPRGHRRWPAEQIAPLLVAKRLPVPESWGVKVAA